MEQSNSLSNQKKLSTQYDHTIANHNLVAPREVVPLVMELVKPQSVLDVGCGIGNWLKVFEEQGIGDYKGVDGSYLDKNLLKIPIHNFEARDLQQSFSLGRKFDLVVSLEVAEHLDERYADQFVHSNGAFRAHGFRFGSWLAHSVEDGLPNLGQSQRGGPAVDVGRINLVAAGLEDTRDVTQVLVRTTVTEEFHFLQHGVLWGGEGCIPAVASLDPPGPRKTRAIELGWRWNDHIHLEARSRLDDIELRATADGVAGCLLTHIEIVLRKLKAELFYGTCRQIHDDIDVVGESRFSIKNGHRRSGHEIG